MTTRFQDLYLNGTCYTSNWFRSYNNTGWYNETHGGGIYMADNTWVRTYGGKKFYCSSEIRAKTFSQEEAWTGALIPSSGSGSSNGIIFPLDPGGGNGDKASIQYYSNGGEHTVFRIKVENDRFTFPGTNISDIITLEAPGGYAQIGYENRVVLQASTSDQTGVIIRNYSGALTDWPGGWGGGIATWDICCSGLRYSAFSQRSDIRIKENIETLSNGLDIILKLNPVSFYYKKEVIKNIEQKQYGYIAQEVEKIIPELVSDGVFDEEKQEEGIKGLNYIGVIPFLTKAIQEQQEIIETQQKRIDSLEERLKVLEDLLK